MGEPLYKEESYNIIGLCLEVYDVLGRGYSEAVYKDALEFEFTQKGIRFNRDAGGEAVDMLIEAHTRQVLNYLATSKLRLGLLVNFGEGSLVSKRVIL
jgi:hypothetical protein